MGTFGERLQREREMRGITLEEIAEATKIGTRSLRALEEQDFDKLPGGIFNKGFVRAYSKYLGIDEDQAVADYVTAVNEAQATGKLSRPEYSPPSVEEAQSEPEPVRIPWGLLIILALIVAVGFAARSYYAKYGWAKLKREATPMQPAAAPQVPATVPQQPSGAPTTTQPAAPAPTPVDAQQTAGAAPATVSDGFVVKVRAKEKSWVLIQADGVEVSKGTLAANAEREVHAARSVVVVTLNAGGIEVSHNGQLLPPLGAENEKKTVVLNAQGIKQ